MTEGLIKLPLTGEPPQIAEIRTSAESGRVFVKIVDVKKAFQGNSLLRIFYKKGQRKMSPADPLPASRCISCFICIGTGHISLSESRIGATLSSRRQQSSSSNQMR